jgi:hypothetical protein
MCGGAHEHKHGLLEGDYPVHPLTSYIKHRRHDLTAKVPGQEEEEGTTLTSNQRAERAGVELIGIAK